MKKLFSLILIIIFILLGFVLNLKNPALVAFSFPFIDVEAPLGAIMLVAIFIGMILGALLVSMSLIKSKIVGNKAKRDLAKVEKEVENLRAMPIKDEV